MKECIVRRNFSFAFLVWSLLTLTAVAQGDGLAAVTEAGLVWTSDLGANVGSDIGGLGCIVQNVSVAQNEIVTLSVYGDLGALYGLAIASTATQCVQVPGVTGFLLVDQPAALLAFGSLAEPTMGPNTGRATLTGVSTLPPGTTFALQAFTFSQAIGSLSPTLFVTAI
jgi:hypothetical protein